MVGALKTQFVDATDMTYNIDNRDIVSHYIVVVDDDANTMDKRYTNLKVDNDTWLKLGLNNINKVKEFQGKMCQFDGRWTKDNKSIKLQSGDKINLPTWIFHVTGFKEVTILEKK